MRLLEITSETYKRRLVKEINHTPLNVYHLGCRVYVARMKGGNLEIRISEGWYAVPDESLDKFKDSYGRDFCASRVA